jgi:phosphatidylglycerophosphatase A
MVWDEIVAFLVILAFTPATLGWQVAAFFLFRLFDVVKPPPLRYFDRTIKNGFGVMLDDLLAAGYTLLVLAIAVRALD